VGERIMIGGNVVVTVVAASDGKVKVGIDAPSGVTVDREEVALRRAAEQETTG
jgi:carbon storage regulator